MLRRPHGQHGAAQAGSTFILMPVAALVFVVLGSLAVDATVLFLAERELAGAAAAAANDAATQAIDLELFYGIGCLQLDEAHAGQVVAGSVAAKRLGQAGVQLDAPAVVTRGREVTVTLTGRAPHVFSKALPGAPDTAPVSATATATAEGPATGPTDAACARGRP